MTEHKKIVFITGATSGIGEACAVEFAKNSYNLILTGRRSEKLNAVKDKLEKEYSCNVLTLNFDVRNKTEVENAVASLPDEWLNINVLVNNAGLALGLNSFQEGLIEDWENMIDTNVKGLLYISRTIAPIMIEKGIKGHIINIGSIAGREVYPNGNIYAATKHAVDALTKAMRFDLLKHEIKVSQVAPGAVETEFSVVRFKGDKNRADAVYQGIEPLVAEDISRVVYYVASMPPHVNLSDVFIMPARQAGVQNFFRKS